MSQINLEWQALKNGYIMATVESGESIEQSMSDICRKIKEYVIPRNDGIAWDVLRIEFWPDSGRMIVFPSATSISSRIEKAGCVVVFDGLRSHYEQLADSDLADDAFVAALLEVKRGRIKTFLDAAHHISLIGYHFQFWDGAGECPLWTACSWK